MDGVSHPYFKVVGQGVALRFGSAAFLWLVCSAFGGGSPVMGEMEQVQPGPGQSVAVSDNAASPAVAGQSLDARQLHDVLPQSKDPIWGVLATTKVLRLGGPLSYDPQYSPEVKALVGQRVSISGFILPIEMSAKFTHFVLSRRTPTCGFCPPGEPNEVVEVMLDEPIRWREAAVTVTGDFSLTDNVSLGVFFKMTHAKLGAKP